MGSPATLEFFADLFKRWTDGVKFEQANGTCRQQLEIQGLDITYRESREDRWLNAVIESSENPSLEQQRCSHANPV